ncbi:MAG: hypothetical protein ABI867_28440 [Kofleriaceae bacterium]
MSRLLGGLFILIALAGQALANGRAPGSSTINFQRGNESHIAAGMTFGVVLTEDNGATWSWMCEEAIGYGGTYDPDYAFTPTGSIFATTFDGLKVNRDGCVYDGSVLSPSAPVKFFSAVTVATDGTIYAANTDDLDGKIYKSTDDGASFPVGVTIPDSVKTWWQSLESAPSSPQVVYLFGYRFTAGQPKQFFMLRSGDAGVTYTPLPGSGTDTPNGIAVMSSSVIEIAAISKSDPNLVYARVTLSDNAISDALYRSTNGGQSWTKILELQGSIAFVVRGNGDIVAGTQAKGSFVSTNQGGTGVIGTDWTPLAGAPHINCLGENSAGEVWACTQNYGEAPNTDSFGIMKTTDLTNWTGVLKFQDLKEPRACPAGTVQKDKCDSTLWCGLCAQLGCDANRECPGDPVPDGTLQVEPGGCCSTGSDGLPGLLVLGIAVAMVSLRRRR